jgi:phytanoyl-CoA hydroxylase
MSRWSASIQRCACLETLRTDGVLIIDRNVAPDLCDQVVADFRTFCAGSPDAATFRDEHSLHDRPASLHLVSEAARRIAFESRAARVVEPAFRSPFVVVGSLFFDKGSTQPIHRDSPAFFTNPLNHFFGVWTALEHVVPSAGPLVYYKRGHTVAPDDELLSDPAIDSNTYFYIVRKQCVCAKLQLVECLPKKGDTLIWHPQLPHGGAAIANPAQSHGSIVFHYIPDGVPIYGPDTFFGVSGRVGTTLNYRTLSFRSYNVIDQGKPRFFHNRHKGNFDEV